MTDVDNTDEAVSTTPDSAGGPQASEPRRGIGPSTSCRSRDASCALPALRFWRAPEQTSVGGPEFLRAADDFTES